MNALIGYTVGLKEDDCHPAESRRFFGFSGPSVPLPDFDHTFVQSAKGDKWGCWGREDDECKKPITSGGSEPFIKLAKCLAKPRGTAAIMWPLTGTCHQAANRILYPAGVTVSDARGFAASVFLYGVYGTDYRTFLFKAGVCKRFAWPAGTFRSREKTNGAEEKETWLPTFADEFEKKYDEGIKELYRQPIADGEMVLAKDLELTIQKRSRFSVTQTRMADIQNRQISLQRKRQALINSLFANEISKHQFLNRMNGLLQEALIDVEKIIGEKQFIAVFDSPPDKASHIFASDKGF